MIMIDYEAMSHTRKKNIVLASWILLNVMCAYQYSTADVYNITLVICYLFTVNSD